MIIVIVQYLDDMILEREKANDALREELAKYVGWCQMLDQSQVTINVSWLVMISQMVDQGQVTIDVAWLVRLVMISQILVSDARSESGNH